MLESPPFCAPLFVPGDRPERFAKAAASGADAIIIDLEDAVAADRKIVARQSLSAARDLAIPIWVRINGIDSPWHREDLAALLDFPFASIMLPKAGSQDDIVRVGRELGNRRRFVPLIETAQGMVNARQIAATPGVIQMAFGPVDYAFDLSTTPNPDLSAHAMMELALASRIAGLPRPLDGPCLDVHDKVAIQNELHRARKLGAGGKLCIHPNQVGDVIAGFAPSRHEIARAQLILAESAGHGARLIDGMLVDRPIVEWARRIVGQRAGR